jgi:hypothetical protein
MATEISFASFDDPIVLDFEDLTPGVIDGTSSFFTNVGIQSVEVTRGVLGFDILNGNAIQGNSLVSVDGQLAIAAVGGSLDDGETLGGPEYTIKFDREITKFGAVLTDQLGRGFLFEFLQDDVTVDTFEFSIPNEAPDLATRYLETSVPFDTVKITHSGSLGGYGVDNITFEQAAGPFVNPDNGHIYFLTDPTLGSSWTDAEAQAIAAGGHLVTINDAEEQAWLNQTFKTYVDFNGDLVRESYWIGLYDPQGDNIDEWSSGEPVTYTNWATGEPSSAGEQFVELNPLFAPGQWNDRINSPVAGLGGRGIVEIVPTSFDSLTVDTLVDENDGDLSPGDVSLREAIAFVNEGGTINFASGLTGTIFLDPLLDQLVIDKALTIDGPGADVITVSGNNQVRVFSIDDGSQTQIEVFIDELTITEGRASGGNFIGDGAGIFNQENLTVTKSIITNNESTDVSGGLFNSGTLLISDSTISNNIGPFGAGLRNVEGIAKVINSTISDNTSTIFGGGIDNVRAELELINTTISSNISNERSGGIGVSGGTVKISSSTIVGNSAPDGSGIRIGDGSATVSNSIIAENSGDNDITGTFISGGFNLIGNGDGGSGFVNGVNGDIVGTTANPVDPRLGPLADNGGPTLTHALLPGSPAIDAGNPTLIDPNNQLAFDQRGEGFPRALDGDGEGTARIDIGAFEAGTGVAAPLLNLSNLTGTVALEFQISREAGFNNIFSFYEVDDSLGTIAGLGPADPGYAAAALERIVPGLALTGVNETEVLRSATLAGGKIYAPILFPDGDRTNPLFAFAGANPGGIVQMQSPSLNTFAFEDIQGGGDQDFNDLVVATRIVGSTGGNEPLQELLDLTGTTGLVQISGRLARDAGFDNRLYFYATDAQGRVDTLLPGTAGYEDAVRDNLVNGVALSGNDGQTIPVEFFLTGGEYYGIAMAVDNDLQNLVTVDDAFSSLGARIQRSGEVFSFEDWTDQDFNDLVLTVETIISFVT